VGQRQSDWLNSPQELEDFYQLVGHLREACPEWRAGQTWFNALEYVRPDLVVRIDGTQGLDPFHDSRKIAALDSWLRMNWNA
jgi:hypothetical protein